MHGAGTKEEGEKRRVMPERDTLGRGLGFDLLSGESRHKLAWRSERPGTELILEKNLPVGHIYQGKLS